MKINKPAQMIQIYEPWITDLEKKYAKEAVDSTWISSTGKFIKRAEQEFGLLINNPNVITANNGTNALHLCCLTADVNRDSVVVIPALTYAASAFAASYCGAKIEFIDSDKETWNMDLDILEKYCKTFRPSHVMAVHLLGNPVNMMRLIELAEQYHFAIIEDACESIGSSIYGINTGNFGYASAFSFYGNKTLTSGEGGMVVTTDDSALRAALILRGQAQDPHRRYWHVDVGHNYRMTNIQAAILCAQIERYSEIMAEKERVASTYSFNLLHDDRIEMQKILSGHRHGQWMIGIKTPMSGAALANALAKLNIDTRPMFYPITDMPPYFSNTKMPVATELSKYCLMLPSSPLLRDDEIEYICQSIISTLNSR